MPTYEYRCTQCKKKFDLFQSMTEPPVKKCKFCGGKAERLISAGAGLLFKGSGFYCTDYRKSGAAKSESKDNSKKTSQEAKNAPAPSAGKETKK